MFWAATFRASVLESAQALLRFQSVRCNFHASSVGLGARNQASKIFQPGNALQDLLQRGHCRRDVLEKMRALFHEAQETVSAERLHESLHRAEIEQTPEPGGIHPPGFFHVPLQ